MTVTTVSFEATVAVRRTIEHIAINERLVSVRITQRGTLSKPSALNKKRFGMTLANTTTEMVMTPDNLALLLAGNTYKTEDLHAVSDAFLESARTKGYMEAVKLHEKEFSKGNPTVFERLQAGEALRMVKIDYGSSMLFDDQGRVLPTGLYYDYMNGNMRNGAYDLEKTIALLGSNPNVHSVDGKALSMKAVPYYNVSAGCSGYVEFMYAPTQEEMTAIWEKAKAMTKRYPSTMLREAAFELDILGLRAGGAARGNSYSDTPGSVESEENDDDNDYDDSDHDGPSY